MDFLRLSPEGSSTTIYLPGIISPAANLTTANSLVASKGRFSSVGWQENSIVPIAEVNATGLKRLGIESFFIKFILVGG